jgi:hypothetical protein
MLLPYGAPPCGCKGQQTAVVDAVKSGDYVEAAKQVLKGAAMMVGLVPNVPAPTSDGSDLLDTPYVPQDNPAQVYAANAKRY